MLGGGLVVNLNKMEKGKFWYLDVSGRLVKFDTAEERDKALKNFPIGTYKTGED